MAQSKLVAQVEMRSVGPNSVLIYPDQNTPADQILSMWRRDVPLYIPFQTQDIVHKEIAGIPDFGRQFNVTLQREADYWYKPYAEFDIPLLLAEAPRIGFDLIDNVIIYCGPNEINRVYGRMSDMWSQLTLSKDKYAKLEPQVSGKIVCTRPNSNAKFSRVRVPLHTFFSGTSITALPMVRVIQPLVAAFTLASSITLGLGNNYMAHPDLGTNGNLNRNDTLSTHSCQEYVVNDPNVSANRRYIAGLVRTQSLNTLLAGVWAPVAAGDRAFMATRDYPLIVCDGIGGLRYPCSATVPIDGANEIIGGDMLTPNTRSVYYRRLNDARNDVEGNAVVVTFVLQRAITIDAFRMISTGIYLPPKYQNILASRPEMTYLINDVQYQRFDVSTSENVISLDSVLLDCKTFLWGFSSRNSLHKFDYWNKERYIQDICRTVNFRLHGIDRINPREASYFRTEQFIDYFVGGSLATPAVQDYADPYPPMLGGFYALNTSLKPGSGIDQGLISMSAIQNKDMVFSFTDPNFTGTCHFYALNKNKLISTDGTLRRAYAS